MNENNLESLIQYILDNIDIISSFAFIADIGDKHHIHVALSNDEAKDMLKALEALNTDILKKFIYN